MEISAKNLNKNSSAVLKTGKKNLSFTGINTGKISNLAEAKKLSKRNLDGIFNALNNKLGDGFIQIGADGTATYKKANALVDTIVYPFTKMPKEFLNSFAKTFKIDNLYLSPFFIVIKIPNGKKGGVVQVLTCAISFISISQLTLSVPTKPDAKKAIRLSVK